MIARGIAIGEDVGPWRAGDQAVKVYYLDGEMPAELMQQREIAFGDASDNLILISHEVLFERTGLVLNLRLPEVQKAHGLVHRRRLQGRLHRQSLDARQRREGKRERRVGTAAPRLPDLRRKKIAVVLVHHAGRSGEMRGTSRREDCLLDHQTRGEHELHRQRLQFSAALRQESQLVFESRELQLDLQAPGRLRSADRRQLEIASLKSRCSIFRGRARHVPRDRRRVEDVGGKRFARGERTRPGGQNHREQEEVSPNR